MSCRMLVAASVVSLATIVAVCLGQNQPTRAGELRSVGEIKAEMFEVSMPLSQEFIADPVAFTTKFLQSHGQVVNRVILAPEYQREARRLARPRGPGRPTPQPPDCKWIHLKSEAYSSYWVQICK